MLDTSEFLFPTAFPAIRRRRLTALQVNLGYRCNQRCLHCHVAAGPDRTEEMSRETVDEVLEALAHLGCSTLDLTGGAPELNPSFRYLVTRARALGVAVIDRCNLTILKEPGQEDLADFLWLHGSALQSPPSALPSVHAPCAYTMDMTYRNAGDTLSQNRAGGLSRVADKPAVSSEIESAGNRT